MIEDLYLPSPPGGFFFDWSFPAAIIWGLLVLASFVGWGRVVGFWLVMPEWKGAREGWGLSAAWGMAVFLIMSGPLVVLSIFSIPFLTLFLLAGLVFAVWQFHAGGKDGPGFNAPTPGWRMVSILLLFFVTLTYVGAVAARRYNENDDFAAYFAFSKMLLDTGTLSDPFNFRMLGALGGQPALVTLIVAYLPWKYANVMDMGIAGLIMIGLTMELVRVDNIRTMKARFIVLTLALTFSMPRVNTASELTGVVLFMALFRLFDLIMTGRTAGWRAALLVGGIGAAAATLRAHNVFVVAVLVGAFVSWRWWQETKERREIVREALLLLIVTIAFLAPWWAVAYRSSGSFLYPLFKGTHRPEFETFSLNLPLRGTLQFIGGFFISTNYLFLFAPACLLPAGQERTRWLILGGALLFISIAFLSQYTFGAYSDLYRYLAPIGLAFGLHTAGILARRTTMEPERDGEPFARFRCWALAAMALMILYFQALSFGVQKAVDEFRIRLAADGQNQLTSSSTTISTIDAERAYPKALAQIPPGSRVLVAVDYPYLFDYRQHSLYSIDIAGAASPAPGLPYFKGAASVKNYLLAQGVRYIVYGPFEYSLFLHSRGHQASDLSHNVAMWRMYARYENEFDDNVDELAKTNPILYDSQVVRVIQLK